MTRQEAGKRRVDAALDAIQEAQNSIGVANSALSGVEETAPEWTRLQRLYDEIKATWWALENRRAQLARLGGPTLAWDPDEESERAGRAW